MPTNNGIFIFWGDDLRQFEPGLLRSHHLNGECLLPVDGAAIQAVCKAGLPLVLPEDWLGVQTTLKAQWTADEWEALWFESARDGLSSDGVCWPIFDREALNWYWRDLTLADAIVKACRKRDVKKVSLVINNPLRPALFYYRSDIHGHLIQAALGDRAVVWETTHDPWPGILTPATLFNKLQMGAEAVSPSRIEGRIVLAINPGEFYRFAPVIKKLDLRFKNQVTVIALWPSPNEIASLAHLSSVEILTPSLEPSVDIRLSKRFFTGYLQAVADARGKPWIEALDLSRFQFEYYCGYRLPLLATVYRSWLNLYQAHRPLVVITSSLADSESQLPALAANRAGIPTVSLPHGGFTPGEHDCHARSVLYNCEPTRKVYAAAGIEEDRLKPCREVINENEYPTQSCAVLSSDKSWRILVLTNPVKIDTCLFNTTMIGSQMAAVELIANPPVNVSEHAELYIKTHPNWHDRALLEAAGKGLNEIILPPDASLAEALEQIDLVIALNYTGTALIYTSKARKPVIFFWNDPLLLRRSHSYQHGHLMLPSGELITNAKDLWRAVERFFTDSAFASSLREKADAFARENLETEDYSSLSDIIAKTIEEGQYSMAKHEPVSQKPRPQTIENILPNLSSLPVDMSGYIFEYGGMPAEELKILCALVRNQQPGTIFEIGTFNGGTTLGMAVNSRARIYTLDLPPKNHRDYRLPTMNDPELDVYPKTPGIRFHKTPHAGRIYQILADSQTFDFSPYFESMDFVFVDACHHYEFVLRDSMNAFKMIRPGGTIVWHDYANWAPGVMQALQVVSQRFPIFHITRTSLAIFIGDCDHIGRFHNQITDETPTPDQIPVTGRQTEDESVSPLPERMQTQLPGQFEDTAPTKALLLERIGQSPGDIDALIDLALIAETESEPDEAMSFLKDALILDPTHERAQAFKAEMVQRAHNEDADRFSRNIENLTERITRTVRKKDKQFFHNNSYTTERLI